MAKYLNYISLYTSKDNKALFNTSEMKLHFKFIQKFNFYMTKLECDGIGRINLIMTENSSEHLNTKCFGSVLDTFIFVDSKIKTSDEIYFYYFKVLQELWESQKFNLTPLKQVLDKVKYYDNWEYTYKKSKYNKSKKCKIALIMKVDYEINLFIKINKVNKIFQSLNILHFFSCLFY